MGKLFKILFELIAVLLIIAIAAFTYLNLIYLPQKVKAEGPNYLQDKSKGRVQAKAISYIPFKGIKLNKVSIVSEDDEPIFNIDKLYAKINLWTLLMQHNIDFRIDLYPKGIKKPFVFKGLYDLQKQKLDVDFKIKNTLLVKSQNIIGKASAELRDDITLDLNLDSPDLAAQVNLYVEGEDLRIEKLKGKIVDSTFDLIGDVQNLSDPSLNIYGNLDIDLAGLEKIDPQYINIPANIKIQGHCLGEVLISSKPTNPRIGLKMHSEELLIDKTKLNDVSIVGLMENKKVSFSKCYAKVYDGEINLQGECNLDKEGYPVKLNLNVFNLEMHQALQDIVGEATPLHGRLFVLSAINSKIQDYNVTQGKTWLSITGSNILQLPIFRDIADVLRFPELRKTEFNEASGNFIIGKRQIGTNDFKIAGENITIYFKGAMDFSGNLGFDVEPNFSERLLNTDSRAGKLLDVLFDSTTGNFMGEIKLKGNINNPRYSFKPISPEKLFQRGLQELFKLKKKEE